MSDTARFVLTDNGLPLAPVGDASYLEISDEDEDAVIAAILGGDDEIPDYVNPIRELNVADLVVVYDAAKALMHSERSWGRRAAEREALANAVAVAGR